MSQTGALSQAAKRQPISTANFQEAVRKRAEEIYIRGGRVPGRDLENWARAEQEILLEAEGVTRRTAVVIEIDGIQYIGEYSAQEPDAYVPGEFAAGEAVSVRLEGEKMFVQRPNGSELETLIVRKAGRK